MASHRTQTVSGPGGQQVDHGFPNRDTYLVRVYAIDKDGGVRCGEWRGSEGGRCRNVKTYQEKRTADNLGQWSPASGRYRT
jgi:hypothetical protein